MVHLAVGAICDDRERVHVHSEVSADIEDGLAILLATRPEVAERGVTITGSDEFRDRAMRVVAQTGLIVANADQKMQVRFASIRDNLKTELAHPTTGYRQSSGPPLG